MLETRTAHDETREPWRPREENTSRIGIYESEQELGGCDDAVCLGTELARFAQQVFFQGSSLTTFDSDAERSIA